MQMLREHIAFKLIWIFIIIHRINFSVDSPDLFRDYVPESLAYNDMESALEILLEKVLEIENAIPEHNEKDQDENQSSQAKKVSDQKDQLPAFASSCDKVIHSGTPLCELEQSFAAQFKPDLNSPPPRL
jgi:hypothetical protein